MKAKLLIDGKEIEVEISEEEYKRLQSSEKKKTGYERLSENDEYYCVSSKGDVEIGDEDFSSIDDKYYDIANYYSSDIIAKNNARADKLIRQLRRFSVEHREIEIDWHDINNNKYYINYDFEDNVVIVSNKSFLRAFGVTYFNSQKTAKAAIDKFRDELIWYFTEYRDSL